MSKKISLDKVVAQDVDDYAFAQMFFGEGAGNRRKLVDATVHHKMDTIPDYYDKFQRALEQVDQTKMAERALRERKRLDAGKKVGQNLRALKSGNMHNLSTGVFIVVAVGYGLHVTGYDKILLAEAKKRFKQAKEHLRNESNVYHITNVTNPS